MASPLCALYSHALLRHQPSSLEVLSFFHEQLSHLDSRQIESVSLDKNDQIARLCLDQHFSARGESHSIHIHRNDNLASTTSITLNSALLDMQLHQGQLWILTAGQELEVYDCVLGKRVKQIYNTNKKKTVISQGRLAMVSHQTQNYAVVSLDNLLCTVEVDSNSWNKYNKSHGKNISHLAGASTEQGLMVVSYSDEEYMHVHLDDLTLPHGSVPVPGGPVLRQLHISCDGLVVALYRNQVLLSLFHGRTMIQSICLTTEHLSLLDTSFHSESLLVAGVLEFQVKCRRLQNIVQNGCMNPTLQIQLDALDKSHLINKNNKDQSSSTHQFSISAQHSTLDLMAVQKHNKIKWTIKQNDLSGPSMQQSMAVLLGQSLRNGDKEMTDYCLLEANELLVKETALRVPPQDLPLLVQTLADRLTSFPQQQRRLALWLRLVLSFHQSHLLHHKTLFQKLQPLMLTIEKRAAQLKRVVSLKERIGVMLSQQQEEQPELVPCVVYQEDAEALRKDDSLENTGLEKNSLDDSFDDSMEEEKQEEEPIDSDDTEEAFRQAEEYYKGQAASEESEEESDVLDQDYIGLE